MRKQPPEPHEQRLWFEYLAAMYYLKEIVEWIGPHLIHLLK